MYSTGNDNPKGDDDDDGGWMIIIMMLDADGSGVVVVVCREREVFVRAHNSNRFIDVCRTNRIRARDV